MNAPHQWLTWAQQIQAIAQNGLTYSENPYDIQRYHQLRQIAAEIMATHTQMEAHDILDLFNQETGYATPKVDVRGAVFRDRKILLVKERADGGWTLPGGWVDIGESPKESIEREVLEESGYPTRAVKLLAVYDRDRHGHPPIPEAVYKLFFLCELSGDQSTASLEPNLETDGVDFFTEDEIPPLSRSRVVTSQIKRLFEHLDHPEWATDFD